MHTVVGFIIIMLGAAVFSGFNFYQQQMNLDCNLGVKLSMQAPCGNYKLCAQKTFNVNIGIFLVTATLTWMSAFLQFRK
jgi:hypothetical protein